MKKEVKGALNIFKDKNYLGCQRSPKKEAFKHLRKARVIIMGVTGLQLLSTSCNTH